MRMQILNSPWHTPIDRKTREIDVRQGANHSQVEHLARIRNAA